MHQYKIIAQTLLVLSILNLVFAAPVPRGYPTPGGTTPLQDPSPSSDGSPPPNSLPEGSAPSSGSPPSSHLSGTDGGAPVYDSTTEARPLSAAGGPAPESHSITPASNPPYYSSATDKVPPAPESIAGESTFPRPSSTTNDPVSMPDSTGEGTTTTHDTPVAKTNKKFMGMKLSKPTGGQIIKYGSEVGYLAALTYAFVELAKLEKQNEK